jgi:predicted metal-dependent hydrolase
MGWVFPKRKQARPNNHYKAHKEFARELITARVAHWSSVYGFSCGRIAIKNQKRCWGSCSAKGNLNFNYKVIFLPESLMDYLIVHELCHLGELNHSKRFWDLVAQTIPDYKEKRAHLRRVTQVPARGFPSSVFFIKQ